MSWLLPLLLAAPGCTLLPFDASHYDADGDGLDWNEDCRDDDPEVGGPRTWYPDDDGDGLGDASDPSSPLCFAPSDRYVENGEDCDDLDAEVGKWPWYADGDGDGYGDPNRVVTACEPPEGYVGDSGDCDDGSAAISPEGTERCGDGVDSDCDEQVDEAGAVDAVQWYFDGDGDGFGDGEPVTACEAPGERYVERTGDCDDSSASANPDAEEICGNVVDDNCNGQGEPDCGIVGGIVSGDLRITGPAGGSLGWSVLSVEAIDGGGEPELLLGAPDGGGAVYLIHSAPEGQSALDSGELDLLRVSSPDDDLLGWALAPPDDLTGDGERDLIFSAPGLDNNRGAAYILPGPLGSGEVGTGAAKILSGAGIGDFAGASLASLGGGALLVGAPQAGQLNKGAAYLVQGPITSPTTALADGAIALRGEAAGDRAGAAVASAGDIDGDGLTDMLIGAPYVDVEGEVDVGVVYLVLAPISSAVALSDADLVLVGEDKQSQAGLSLSPGGSVYQFQEPTVLVGAPSAPSSSGEPAGRSYLLTRQLLVDSLSSTDPLPLSKAEAIFLGGEADDEAATVAAAGDLDGDSRDDIAIGAPGATRGQVYVWYGRFSLQGRFELADADAVLLGQSSQDGLGAAISGGWDLDGDGYGELLIGAFGFDGDSGEIPGAGAVYVLRGGPGD